MVEIQLATVNFPGNSLLDDMNIQTDIIIGNQCKYNSIEKYKYKNFNVRIYSNDERGVGLNRNTILMRSDNKYGLIADDDLVYVDEYENIIVNSFNKHPEADILVFNLNECKPTRYIIKKEFKVTWFNFMRFGAARICIRNKSIRENGINFNLSYGGGCIHSNGEDTLFLSDCLKKKLNIIALPIYIAELKETHKSTWFNGYTAKYFYDKGFLYYQISKRLAILLCFQDCIRHRKLYKKNVKKTFSMMLKGIKKAKMRGDNYEHTSFNERL